MGPDNNVLKNVHDMSVTAIILYKFNQDIHS